MKKHNQKGFGLVEALLIIIAAGIVGFGGYYVWHNQKTSPAIQNTSSANLAPTSSSSTSKLSLNDGKVNFLLPKDWEATDTSSSSCLIIVTSDIQSCLAGAIILPSALKNVTSNGFSVNISVFELKSSSTDPEKWFVNDYQGGLASLPRDTTSKTPINGYNTYYFQQKVSGDQSYQDENYIMLSGGKVVHVYSRVKYQNPGSNINDDFTKYLPDIKNLVDSINII